MLEIMKGRARSLEATIRRTDTMVAHHAVEGCGRLLARFEGRVVTIGFIGDDYLIEFVDDAGRVFHGQGDRLSAAWDQIEAQQRAEAIAA